mgnify:CR=1 FL=1
MAWALQFDGQNDYADISTPIDLTGDFTIEFELDLSASRNDGFIESSTGTNNFFGKLNNNSIYCRLGGQTITYSQTPPPGVNKYKWIKSGNNITCYFNGTVKNSSTTFTGGSTLNRFGRFQGGSNMLGQLLSCTGVDSNGASFNYDPTSSSHAAGTPILTDTAGGNNATGVNMPTDGSAWVNLGGGGISIVVDSGSYSQAGTTTPINAQLNIITTSGSYLLTGSDVNLTSAKKLIAETGSYDLTGTDVILIYTPGGGGDTITVDSGVYSLAGDEVLLRADLSIIANSDNYSITGTATPIKYNASITVDSGSYSLVGADLNLFANYGMIAISNSYSLTGTSVTLRYSGDTSQVIGTVTAGFAPDLYSAGYKPNKITVTFKE